MGIRKSQVQRTADAMDNEAALGARYVAHGEGSLAEHSRAMAVTSAALRNCSAEEQAAAIRESRRRG